MEERTITLEGRGFRYLERPGPGPALLFLHGLGDSADQFVPIASRLPDARRLLALDQRGHGGSWKPDAGYSPQDFADDAAAFLGALGIEAVHLFGHSMGGRNAMVLAAERPSLPRSLILGDIGSEENQADIEATRRFFERLPETFAGKEEALEHWRSRKPGYSEENLGILMKGLEAAPDGSLRWRFSRAACIAAVTAARSRDWYDHLAGVTCPALLLHAEESTELGDEVAARMRAVLPGIRYVRVPGCGHNFQLENPAFAATEIERFLTGIEKI